MSATAEKPKQARRSPVERLQDELAKRRAKIEAAKIEIADLAGKADQAAAESLKADPSNPAFALRTPAYELNRKRSELEKSIGHLEKEVLLLEGQLGAAQAEEAAAELAEFVMQAKRLAERERELRREAGEAFAGLAEVWGRLAEVLSSRSALAARVEQSGLVRRIGIFDREAEQCWQEASTYAITPVPTTLATFVDELLEASLAERTDVAAEYRAVDEINARRRAIAAKDPGGASDLPPIAKPIIQPNALDELVPDLRETVATATVTGAPIRRRERPETGWPGEAA
jgi:hypothetical protein